MGLLDIFQVRRSQGSQYVADLRHAVPSGFVGRPTLAPGACANGCTLCLDACPTRALTTAPLSLDLGRCVFCRECELVCPQQMIAFTAVPHMAAAQPHQLLLQQGQAPQPVPVNRALKDIFGRSLKLRSVSTGGCNACELELNALGNVNFDLGRYGIEFVASPRHADALVISGPLTRNMEDALELTWAALPDPRFVIAFGACAISGGLYQDAPVLNRAFLDRNVPALLLPGCPPHPLTFIAGIMDLLGIPAPPRESAALG